MSIPISTGSGVASVAAEALGGLQYQQIKVIGGETGSTSTLGISPDGSAKVSVVGTLTTQVSGSIAAAIVSGSVAVTTGNSSVQVLNFPTSQNVSGSVAAWMQSTNASIITVGGASGTSSVIQQGTWASSIVSSTPSSVLVGASIFGQLPGGTATLGSVATLQGTNPWVITGSVQGSFSPSGNQSVSGTVGASVIGVTPIVISGGGGGTTVEVLSLTNSTVNTNNHGISTESLGFQWNGGAWERVQGNSSIGTLVSTTNSSVITVGQGSIAAAIVSGSVAVATGNSSVQVLNFPTTQNVSGSVVGFQGTNPWIITGSVQGSFSPSGNQSVSGRVETTQTGTVITSIVSSFPSSVIVGASIFGLPPVNVTNFPTTQNVSGSVAAWLQSTNASIITVGGASGSSSVQGTQATGAAFSQNPIMIGGKDTDGSVVAARFALDGDQITHIHSSIISLVDNAPNQVAIPRGQDDAAFMVSPSYQYVFDGTTWDRMRGDSTNGQFIQTGNASVIAVGQGSVAVAIVSGSVAVATGNSSVQVLNFPTTQNVSGSVVGFQGTNPWIITGSVQGSFSPSGNQSVSGTVGASVIGTVPITQSGTFITSIISTVPSSVIVGASIFGLPPVNVTNFPTTQNVSGSVAAWLQSTNASIITVGGASGNSSVQVLNFPSNQSVSGTVGTTQTGTVITSIVSTVPSSVIVGASIFGLPPVNVTNFPTTQNVSGSVAAWLQSTNASVITVGTAAANQSVSGTVGASVIGTVPVTQSGTNITSIVSTVPSSVIVGTSIFGQLPGGTAVLGSVATLQGTNPWVIVGSVYGSGSVVAFQGGTNITSISGIPQASVHGFVGFTPASILSGHASLNGAASVQVLAAPGTGLYNYITDFSLANTGAATTLVTFTDGDGSIMGKAIAPTGGGAIATAISSPMKTLQTNKVVNVVAATATSVLHAWVGGYKAP